MTFTARATGRFTVEPHLPSSGGHAHGTSLSPSRSILRSAARQPRRGCAAGARRPRRRPLACNAGRRPRLRPALRPADPALRSISSAAAAAVVRVLPDRRIVRAARARRAPADPHRPAADADRTLLASPALAFALKLARARRLHHHHRRGAARRPEPVPEHRAHHGVDHLVDRPRLCFGAHRKSVGADQSLANDFRGGRDHLSGYHRAARAFASPALPAGARASGPHSSCCWRSPGSSWSIPIRRCRAFIAWLAIAYSILTFAGMFLFGRSRWLERGEVFTLVFGTFARFAPIELRTGAQRALSLRPFGAGLLDSRRGLDLDDGVRAAPARERAVRRRARHSGMGQARTARWRAACPAFGDLKFEAVRTRGPDRVLARVLRRLCRGLRR